MTRYIIAVILLLCSQLVSASQVRLTWDINSGADPSGTVAVYKSNNCTIPYTIVQTQSASLTTWTDSQVEAGKTYCWYVVGRLNGKESTPSNVLTFSLPQEPTIPVATNLRGAIE